MAEHTDSVHTFKIAAHFASPTGAVLNVYSSLSTRPATGIVQINHGLAEHAGRYARFARHLSENGFHVYAHDHRGHGHTTAPGAPRGSFGPEPAIENVLSDVLAVYDHIARTHPGLPVILFGHSLGAMIGLVFLMRHAERVSAAALWNMPLANPLGARAAKAVLAWERFRLGSDVPSRILPRLTFEAWGKAIPGARTFCDWLSHDSQEVDRYMADPLCGWLPTVGMWRAVFDLNLIAADGRWLESIPRSLPIQLVGGGSDPSTEGGKTVKRLEERLQREGFSRLETTIYPRARHESLNETNRDEVMRDFVAWAERAVG